MSFDFVALSELSEVVSKGTTPTSVGFDFLDSGVPFVRSEDVLGGEVAWGRVSRYISIDAHQALRRSALHPRDVLITIAGTIGRVGYVGDGAPALNCNQAVAFVRLKPDIVDPVFICFALRTPRVQRLFSEFVAGGAIPNVNLEQIRSIEVPLPAIDKQRRIAAHLKVQLAAVEEARQAAQAQLKEIELLPSRLLTKVFEAT